MFTGSEDWGTARMRSQVAEWRRIVREFYEENPSVKDDSSKENNPEKEG